MTGGPLKKARFGVEYAGALAALAALDLLPVPLAMSLARAVADVAFAFDRKRRNTAVGNILSSGIASSRPQAGRIARESYRHMACLIVESQKFSPCPSTQGKHGNIEMRIPAETMAILAEPNRGVILASGHLGNWEVAAQALSSIKPVTGITRKLNNPYVNRLMEERKARHGFSLTPKRDADKTRFLSVLARGEILAILMDQFAPRHGVMVEFFGRPASTHTSPALLHLVSRAPIVLGYCLRTGPMSFTMTADPPIEVAPSGNRAADVAETLRILTGRLEEAIRSCPGQYVWGHRRWRPQPGISPAK